MIKKILSRGSILLILFALIGCNQLAKLATQYALSESMLDRYLQGYTKSAKTFNVPGLVDTTLGFDNLKAKIGENGSNKVTLSGTAKFGLSSILGSQNADISLTLAGQPMLDKQTGAIYLKQLELSNYQLESSLGSDKKMGLLLPYLNKALQLYFDQQPVYTLNADNNPLEAVALKLASNLEVKNGEIVFPFKEK